MEQRLNNAKRLLAPSLLLPNVEETADFSGTGVNNPDASVPSLESAETTDSLQLDVYLSSLLCTSTVLKMVPFDLYYDED